MLNDFKAAPGTNEQIMAKQFFVNHESRMCRMLGGGCESLAVEVAGASREGFVDVTLEAMEAFRADTKAAITAGWKPNGRTSYAKFMDAQLKQ